MKYFAIDFLHRAGPIIYVIFFLSMTAWYLTLRGWLACTREERAAMRLFMREEVELADNTETRNEFSYLIEKEELIKHSLGPYREMEMDIFCRCLSSTASTDLHTMKTLASLAPLLGLLGTVAGMIKTFQVIRLFGGANPALMAEGISEALLTTQAGLVAAFPVIFFHTLLKRKWETLTGRIREFNHSLREV